MNVDKQQVKKLKAGDKVQVYSSAFIASPIVDGTLVTCTVRDVNPVGQVYVFRDDRADGLYVFSHYIK
jgi:hypothetical protein